MNARKPALVLAILGVGITLLSCSTHAERWQTPTPRFLNSPEALARGFPFSEAVRVEDTLYLSGQIGTRPGTSELVPGGIVTETRQTLLNIKSVLARYGSSLERVVKCTVFMADMAEWPRMNEVYRTFFKGRFPARSAMGASGLALGARVEIECIAVVGKGKAP